MAVDGSNVMAVGGEVCRECLSMKECVHVRVRHGIGDSSQVRLRLNLRMSVCNPRYLSPSVL